MIEIAYVVLLGTIYFIGYFTRSVIDTIRKQLTVLSEKLKTSQSASEEVSAPKSMLVEPLTPEQQERQRLQESIKRLNS